MARALLMQSDMFITRAMRMTSTAVNTLEHSPRASAVGALPVLRADSAADLLRCRQYVYRSYEQKGYLEQDLVKAKAAGTFHADGSHASLMARRRGQTFFVESKEKQLEATGTLIRDLPKYLSANGGLPLDKTVPLELAALRQKLGPNALLAEVGALASSGPATSVLRAMRRGESHTQPLIALFHQLHRHALSQGVTDLVLGVHPTHAGFYERLGFRAQPLLSTSPVYAGLQHAEVVLLHGSMNAVSTNLSGRRSIDVFEAA